MQSDELASVIRRYRKRASLSLLALARHAGVSGHVVQDLEAEAGRTTWARMVTVLRALNIRLGPRERPGWLFKHLEAWFKFEAGGRASIHGLDHPSGVAHIPVDRPRKNYPVAQPVRGFALVPILTLMVLLALVALGLMSLSSIAMRSSTQNEAKEVARSNARLGLMLALGEIQMLLRPDQKINAVSGILASAGSDLQHSRLTGVWDSRQEVLGEIPDYTRAAGFNRWLVSSSNPDELLRLDFPKTGTLAEPVVMVARRADDDLPLFAGKIAVPTRTPGAAGRLAWWVADENSKGFTNPEDPLLKDTATPSVPDFLAAAGTPGAHGMQAIDIDYPANTEVISKVISHHQLMLASSSGESQNWFHDFSPHSKGLLTNVVNGGLRQDLSLYLEQSRPNDPWPNSPAPQALGPNGKSPGICAAFLHLSGNHLVESVQRGSSDPRQGTQFPDGVISNGTQDFNQ